MKKKPQIKDLYDSETQRQFDTEEIRLGPWTSYSLINDPKHMCFVLSRYKFCAKMLSGKQSVLEVGCGDGFGIPIMAQSVKKLYVADWEERLIKGNVARLSHLKNVEYIHHDFNLSPLSIKMDAVIAVDLIEHLDPENEAIFTENMVACLKPTGTMIIGTPNITASQYASPQSEALHINLQSMKMLRELMERFFDNVFLFGMNDEVLHTGYDPMCHYLWSIGAGVKPVSGRKLSNNGSLKA